jgi:dihydrofolate reductase
MKAIACKAANDMIGSNGTIPWKMPKDMQHFKKSTIGHTILVGRRTWESFPKALPGRKTIIWSSRPIEGMPTVQTLGDIEQIELQGDLWVCGGFEVYKATMPYWTELVLTQLKKPFDGDVYFPKIEGFSPVEELYDDEDMTIKRWLPTSSLSQPA